MILVLSSLFYPLPVEALDLNLAGELTQVDLGLLPYGDNHEQTIIKPSLTLNNSS